MICLALPTMASGSPLVVRATMVIAANGCCSIVRYISYGTFEAKPNERTLPTTPMTCHQSVVLPDARRRPMGSRPGQNFSAIARLMITTCVLPFLSRTSNRRPWTSGMPIVLK